jgi:zeaxanthin glucosyltransferase
VVTHAGLNTALESLAEGVPTVAIPITNDQPGVAARLAWTGCGLTVPPKRLTVPRLRQAVERVLKEPAFRANALRMQAAIRRGGGTEKAATIIEKAVSA